MIAKEYALNFGDVPDDRCVFPNILDEKDIWRLPKLLEYFPPGDLKAIQNICTSCEEIGGAIIRFINTEGPCTIDYALHHCTRGHFDALPPSHPVHTIIRDWLRKSIWDSLARPECKMSPDILDMRITAKDLDMKDIEYPQNKFLASATRKKAEEKRTTIEAHGEALVRQLIGDIDGCASTDHQKTIARALEFWIYYSARKKLKKLQH